MKFVIQRCRAARVEIDGQVVGQIERGLTIFVGVANGDDEMIAAKWARKIVALRIFDNDDGRFDCSLRDSGGSALVISNFTLLGEVNKGNRPYFGAGEKPDRAREIYQSFVKLLREQGIAVESGTFAADMRVVVENDGPVTLVLGDS